MGGGKLDLSEELIKTHPELQMDTFLKGSVTSQEELDELLLPIQNAMNRYRTGLGMCLFPLIREFPLDQLGNFGGEFHTVWEKNKSVNVDGELTEEWKRQVVLLFLNAKFCWRKSGQIRDYVEQLQNLSKTVSDQYGSPQCC
uniref:Uncharacterized protein n=1 Tax=Guillardia theta TaxID=55529 RepID=A0A7S4JJ23_GUITH|mmetsp:Transcript_16858/g.55919  ORF Transcript_16858/g.55919 Transcript_16858/m.55919 type:complete len:142 (+) Transcript_16858:758-1183(+)